MSKPKRRMATVKHNNEKAPSTGKWKWAAALLCVATLSLIVYSKRELVSEFASQLFTPGNEVVKIEPVATVSERVSVANDEGQNAFESSSEAGWVVALHEKGEFVTASMLEEYLKERFEHSFFTLDMGDVSTALLEYPWLRSVRARKVWPNILLLEIEEHQPWLNLNDAQVISSEGVVFTPESMIGLEQLPKLEGQFGSLDDLLSMYHFFSEQMPDGEFRIVRLSFHSHNGWDMTLGNGIELYLGKQDLSERLERFLTILQKVNSKKRGAIDYIDLRYPTGVAVGWKKQEEQIAQQ